MFRFKKFYIIAGLMIFILMPTVLIFADPAWAETQQAEHIPWSGYWWPTQYGGLATGADYRGHPAPLEKYEMLTTGGSTGSPLIDWYSDYYYNPSALPWNGLCPYWARAAMWESYDILPSSEDNIVFRVGDKKGLLVLCHDKDMMTTQSGKDPVNFHRWLLKYIKDQKTAFTADLGWNNQVWYYPVYKYDMTSAQNGLSEDVDVTIYYADDGVDPDYMGTYEREYEYTYTLVLNSQGDIIDGEWTGDSVDVHPVMLAFPLTAAAKSPYIDADEVRKIAQSKGNDLDHPDNSPVKINPGAYHLALVRQNQYVVEGKPGDELFVKVLKENGSQESMDIAIADDSGEAISHQTLKFQGESMSLKIDVQHSPYTITLAQDDYTDPNIYTLSVDKLPAYRQRVPYIPKNGMWSGFALTNPGDTVAENVSLLIYTDDGSPLQTVLGPLSLNPHEKRVFLYDDLNWRKHEYTELDSLALLSDQPVQMINLFGFSQKAMAGFVQGEAHGVHLVIPDTFLPPNAQYMQGGVFNETFVNAPVDFHIYAATGEQKSEFSNIIPAGGKYIISPGTAPFNHVPNGGWIDVLSTQAISLSGYQYVKVASGKQNSLDALFAMPVGTTSKIVPHITSIDDANWETHLTLMNPNDMVNTVSFHLRRAGDDHNEDQNIDLAPHEKRMIDLTQEFGKLPGDALFHSILDIAGQYPIVGYYSFIPQYGGDSASYPLMDAASFKPEVVLPHDPEPGQWWTGIGVCNPNGFSLEVAMEPYDHTGNMMSENVVNITLAPGAYDVFLTSQMFGHVESDISFIKFRSKGIVDAPIGGFYLYGNMKNGIESMESIHGENM